MLILQDLEWEGERTFDFRAKKKAAEQIVSGLDRASSPRMGSES